MGSRGPQKMPTALKVLHGETRSSRLNKAAPKPRANRPAMPRDMSLDAKKVWARIMRDFGHTGILTAVDTDSFRAYCEAVARYKHAATLLESSGPLVRGRDGNLVRNPLHQIVRDNAILMRAFARELGFAPAAREGLTMPDATSTDPFDAWAEAAR